MKIVDRAVKKVYRFNCPNCQSRLEGESKEFEDIGGKISKFFCPVCKKDRYITWSDLRKKTVYEGGDKMMVPLGKLGNFTATVQKVTNNKVLFIFDDYVAKRPMNEDGGNAGGYSQSDLKKWIDSELYNMFPAVLKQRMTGLSIPTLGEICGWADKWDRDHIEADGDEQLPLMKQRRNRVAYYKNDCEFGWLRNATKKEFSSANFAHVDSDGSTDFYYASTSNGVRPEFWLVR